MTVQYIILFFYTITNVFFIYYDIYKWKYCFHMWIYFLLLVSCHANVMTYQPDIIDTYDIALFNENPYFNKTMVNQSSIVFQAVSNIPIYVYDLNLVRTKRINEITIECYNDNFCPKTVTSKEIAYLKLYASMLEASGMVPIHEEYSLGILRDTTSENIVGQFTKSFEADGSLRHMTFWIRLEEKNQMVYDDFDALGLTVSMLELSVHERTHYDVTLTNLYAGHCDMYQTQYNTLIREASKEISSYLQLTNHIMKYHSKRQPLIRRSNTISDTNTQNDSTIVFVIIGIVVAIASAILVALYCKNKKK